MIIKKTYETETSHRVLNADSVRCSQGIHGHSYKWEVEIAGPINPHTGMVIDFGSLKPIKQMIDKFDHAFVLWQKEEEHIIDFHMRNSKRVIIMRDNVTAENMALMMAVYVKEWLEARKDKYPGCFIDAVNVWETRTGCARATGSDVYSDDYKFSDFIVYMHEEV